MSEFLLSWASDVSLYLGVPLGLWLSFRVLGYPDLSVEYLFVLGGALFATLVGRGGASVLVPLSLVVLATVLGFSASAMRNRLRIHPILISLAAAYLYYSVILVLLGAPNRYFGDQLPPPSRAEVIAISSALFVLAVGMLAMAVRTTSGLKLLACGCNPQLAKRHGLSPTLWQGIGLAISFLLVMSSGALFAWRAGSIDVSHGSGLLLISIFVVVLTRALQKRVRPWNNFAGILLALLLYLGALDLLLLAGTPPQWLRGMNAIALLVMVMLLPRKDGQLLRI